MTEDDIRPFLGPEKNVTELEQQLETNVIVDLTKPPPAKQQKCNNLLRKHSVLVPGIPDRNTIIMKEIGDYFSLSSVGQSELIASIMKLVLLLFWICFTT